MFDRNPREETEAVLAFIKPEFEADAAVRYPYFAIDHNARTAYVYINDLNCDVARTEAITDRINADYDKDGNVVGIEFLELQIDFGEEFRIKLKGDE